MKKAYRIFFILITVSALIISITGCQLQLQQDRSVDATPLLEEPPQPRYNVAQVEKGIVTEKITGLARVVSARTEQLYFQRSGRVEELLFDNREWVEEGQLLARLDTEELEYRHTLLSMDLRQAEIRLKRAQELYATEAITRHELALHELNYQRQKLSLQQITDQLAGSRIEAPFDGLITAISMRRGRRVSAFQTVLTLADPEQLVLQMEVNLNDLWYLVPGQRARIRIDNIRLDAVVVRVPSLTIEGTGPPDRRIFLEIPNLESFLAENDMSKTEILLSNILPRVEIIVNERESLLIPRSALRSFGERTFVHIREDGMIREADVETGMRIDNKIEILEGLEEGQELIIR